MPPLAWFAVRRIAYGLMTLWFAVTITFLLLRLLPGDPAQAIASTNMDAAMRQDLLTKYGLTDPLPIQYGKYLVQLVQGNLGNVVQPVGAGHYCPAGLVSLAPAAHRFGSPGEPRPPWAIPGGVLAADAMRAGSL